MPQSCSRQRSTNALEGAELESEMGDLESEVSDELTAVVRSTGGLTTLTAARANRRTVLRAGLLSALALGSGARMSCAAGVADHRLVGMYIHMHWPYRHPYSARTWSVQDWLGYLRGLARIGFNAVVIWPLIETMPDPPTDSDRQWLDVLSVIKRAAQTELGMRVHIVLTPNIASVTESASKHAFSERPFASTTKRIDPANSDEMRRMMQARFALLRSLSHVDGVVVIDSDPGGYPGSTNEQFLALLLEHRRMLDRLRPGIQLDYWIWHGWAAVSRDLAAGDIRFQGRWGEQAEDDLRQVLRELSAANPEPWGIWRGTPSERYHERPLPTGGAIAQRLAHRTVNFPYGDIEREPSFPFTNYDEFARRAGSAIAPRGVFGQAQMHCLQLPGTFAFARAALGKPTTRGDLAEFAAELVPGLSDCIVRAWEALSTGEAKLQRALVAELRAAKPSQLQTGPLDGLLFADAERFITDLCLQLELKAFAGDLFAAPARAGNPRATLAPFVSALRSWQQRHGYSGSWTWSSINPALKRVAAQVVDPILEITPTGASPQEVVRNRDLAIETQTGRLISALEEFVRAHSSV
jgi:hypothetical protein